MKIYLIIIITLFILIILPLIIFYIAMYIRNRRFSNIKGDRPPDPSVNPNPDNPNPVNPNPDNPNRDNPNPDKPNPDVPKEPYIISAYKHSLDLTSYFLNRYEIKCKFYNNYTLHIDMDVFDKKGEQIATNAFYNNTWTVVSDGYQISFDPDLLNQVKNAPVKCNLDNHIIYKSGSPNKIIVSGSVKLLLLSANLNEEIEQCSDINC